jgi:glycosyltransferase involved in cell wall biosynthesis
MVTVICPVYNEEKYIIDCIDSILSQEYPKNDMEVLFIDGNSTDNTVNILEKYAKDYPFITIIHNPARIAPVAMNLGIKASHGDIVVRLDAHATYATNYISVLVNKLIELNADNVGAPCKTDVLNKNAKTLAIREVLSNRVGVGNSVFRIGIDKVKEVDTVPFGCWKRDVFDRFGYFDERLARNQDIELNKRIKRGGGKIYLVPDTHCTYFAREAFVGLAKNNYANGKWNILTVFYTKQLNSVSIRHIVPLIFVFSLLLPLVFSVINVLYIFITLISFLAYVLLIICISFFLALKKKLNMVSLFFSFIVLHFSYGWGSLIGIVEFVLLKMRKAK